MNKHYRFQPWLWLFGAAISASGFMALPTHGQQVVVAQAARAEGKKEAVRSNIVISKSEDDHSVQIQVEDGKVRVVRDGEEIPQAQIIQDDGQIIITDKDGNKVQAVEVRMLQKPGSHAFFTGASGEEKFYGVPKVMFGVHMTQPGPALEKHLGLESDTATMISGVSEGLPADQAGLAEFDVIIKIDGKSPADNETIRKSLSEKEPGDTITFTVIQAGKKGEVKVKLAAYDQKLLAGAKLLGSSPESAFSFFKAGEGESGAWQLSSQLSEFPVVVGPSGEKHLEAMRPHLEQMRGGRSELMIRERNGVDERLQRLDDRMAELERLLKRLAEKSEDNR